MQESQDSELLRQYVREKSDAAFAALVARHVNMVYSAGLRKTGNPAAAQEITQAVFIILAQKANRLLPHPALSGWLYQTTRLTAANFLRTEIRRTRREQEAYMQSLSSQTEPELWTQITPLLEDAMGDLGEKDRNALALRFFEGKTFSEIGAAFRVSENAARKRTDYALEKLRAYFFKRGVTSTTGSIAAAMSANSVHAAPALLAKTAAAVALAKGATASTSTLALVKGALKIMAWSNSKVVIGASVVVLLAVQHHQNTAQARQIAAARQQLNGQAEALASAASRAQELEQQTAGILETESSQQKDLERLQARRKAAGQGSRSLAGAHAPTTLLAAALGNPDVREALRRQLFTASRTRWSPLIDGLKLNQEDTDKLLGIGADQGLTNLETAVAFTEGNLTAEAAVQAEADTERDTTNQIRLLLGDAGFAGYQECQMEFPARTLVDQFNKQLGPFPINAYQQEALARVIEAEPPDVASGLAGDFTVRELVSPDGLDGRFAAQAESNQRILQAAAGFLSPEQVESLRLMQISNMSAQKQTVLRMLRKL
ncbi:MAG: sigma-70 family RNA polymerase sigma factor [Verrucomicrobiia bacterium]